MAPHSIYITDLRPEDLIVLDSATALPPPRTQAELYNIFNTNIIPLNNKPIDHHPVRGKHRSGTFVKFDNDQDINFICTPENIIKLRSLEIKAEFSYSDQERREIYIKAPTDILDKSSFELTLEFENIYQEKILYLKKFTPEGSVSKFLIIALKSNVERNNFTANNKTIWLFDIELTTENRRPKHSNKKKLTQARPSGPPFTTPNPPSRPSEDPQVTATRRRSTVNSNITALNHTLPPPPPQIDNCNTTSASDRTTCNCPTPLHCDQGYQSPLKPFKRF